MADAKRICESADVRCNGCVVFGKTKFAKVHHDGATKENRIAAEDRASVERGPCAVGLGRVDAAVFQGHQLCVPRY